MDISEKLRRINCILAETSGLYHKLNVELGLSDSIAEILYLLYTNNGCYPILRLREELSMPKQTLNSALRVLERQEILFLEQYSGRNKIAVLTDNGWQYCGKTVAYILKMEEDVLKEFSDAELESFINLHEKYNAKIGKYIASARLVNGQE